MHSHLDSAHSYEGQSKQHATSHYDCLGRLSINGCRLCQGLFIYSCYFSSWGHINDQADLLLCDVFRCSSTCWTLFAMYAILFLVFSLTQSVLSVVRVREGQRLIRAYFRTCAAQEAGVVVLMTFRTMPGASTQARQHYPAPPVMN